MTSFPPTRWNGVARVIGTGAIASWRSNPCTPHRTCSSSYGSGTTINGSRGWQSRPPTLAQEHRSPVLLLYIPVCVCPCDPDTLDTGRPDVAATKDRMLYSNLEYSQARGLGDGRAPGTA